MKILFVNNFRGRGGGEEFLRDLLPGLAAQGVHIGLVCRPDTPLASMFSGGVVHLYPLGRDGAEGIRSTITLSRIIREGGYEIVDIQRGHDIIQAWTAARLSRRDVRLLYTPQVPEFIQSRVLLGRMDRIVTISRYIREKIIAFSPSLADRISIIHYGIDVESFDPAGCRRGVFRSRLGLPPDAPVIGMVGDLWKNQIEFLSALAELRKSVPKACVVLAADETGAPEVQRFKEETRRLGLTEAVFWGGRLSKAEMPPFYADMDLAVSTHRNEGFGIWILEALAMGKPVVAFDAGGIRDSLEGCPAGVLVNGGAPEMAREISGILTDKTRYEGMARDARGWVRGKFTRERMVDDYHAYFSGLIGESLSGSSRKPGGRFRVLLMISKNDKYGAQRVFLDQAAALRESGHSVVVVGRGAEGFVADSVRALGIEYIGIPMQGVRDLLFLRRVVRQKSINIIHTSLDRADYFGILLSRLTGRPWVSTMNVRRYHTGYRFADRVVTVSKRQRELLTTKGVAARKISVMRPWIDGERYTVPDAVKRDAWRKKLRADQFTVVFCHISSIIPQKSHAVSLELVAECKKRGETPLLIIAGDPLHGEYYASLVREIERMGLGENTVFTGWSSELPELLSLSNFTLLPSVHEAFGMVLLEGMASGTPIVAREGEGGAELIEEYGTGILYRPDDGVAGLAEKVLSLWRDRSRYALLSQTCRDVVRRHFSMERYGQGLASLYQSIER